MPGNEASKVADVTRIGTGVPKSQPFAVSSEMALYESIIKGSRACTTLRDEPACTIVLSSEGKLSFRL